MGLHPGDIILSVNNSPVGKTASYELSFSKYALGEKIELLVLRQEEEKTFTMILDEGQRFVPIRDLTNFSHWRGVLNHLVYDAVDIFISQEAAFQVAELSEEIQRDFNVDADKGLFVFDGDRQSQLGLGDVILAVNDLEVSHADQLQDMIDTIRQAKEESLDLVVVREGKHVKQKLDIM
jgi:S1-C subfamily serine protease